MNPDFDYRKFAVLYVDDEEKSLRMFAQAYGEEFRILTAPGAAEGHRLLEQHGATVGLLISDQRMPGEKGVQFLEKSRQTFPQMVRILATAYSDLDAAISAVNSGAIYKYVTKPWDPVEMRQVLRQALQFFLVQQERDQLLREKLSNLHRLMIADRIISVGMLSAGLSHHIRNSLVAIRTFLDLAPVKLAGEQVDLNQLRDPDYWRGFHAQVQGQIQRITEILGGLGVATESSPESALATIHIPQLLDRTLAAAREQLLAARIRVSVDCAPGLPPIHADAAKLRHLFKLLIEDEIISLPPDTQIHIQAVSVPETAQRAALIRLEFRDNGPGLEAEDVRSIFDPFFIRTGDPQDLGINLMACYFIVHHHGGTINVQSQPGQGTAFTIELPLEPTPPAPPTATADDAQLMRKLSLYNELWDRLSTGQSA
jgi:two-component system probable response regulator PhcQ